MQLVFLNLHGYLFANKLVLKSILRSVVFSTVKFFLCSARLISCHSISWIPFVCLLRHPSTPASDRLPTEQQYNGHFVNTLFISSTHHCLSLLIAFNTLFLSRLPLFCLVVDVMHLWSKYISMVASLSGYYQFLEPDSKMPGHDHSLRKLYTIEGLSNPSMVYNWVCPVLL